MRLARRSSPLGPARVELGTALAGLSASAIVAIALVVSVPARALAQGPALFRAFVPYSSVVTTRPTPTPAATPEVCTETESQDYGRNGTIDRVVTLTFAGHADPVREEIDEDADGSPDSITTFRYNSSGVRTALMHDGNADGIFELSARYYHDAGGKPLWTEISSFGVLQSVLRWQYDDQGQLVRHVRDEDADGLLDFIREYGYNSRGLVALIETDDDADSTIDSIGRYFYDDNDNLIRHEIEELDGSLLDSTRLYDWQDNLLVRYRWDLGADGVIDSITQYNYDAEGREVLVEVDRQADGEFDDWTQTQYNASGKVASVILYRNRAWHDSLTHTYYESGRLALSIYESESYGTWSKRYEYSCAR